MCKGKKRISSSDSYVIESIDKKAGKMVLAASDSSPRELDLYKVPQVLKRPYSRTCHSVQGVSLGNTIYVHDVGTPMATYAWVRTAISRCSTLDITIVSGSGMQAFDYHGVHNRIAGHQAADKEKGFEWSEDKYVSVGWVKEKLIKQRYQCYHHECRKALDSEYSIDRIQNDIAHVKSNCSLSCMMCQHRSGARK